MDRAVHFVADCVCFIRMHSFRTDGIVEDLRPVNDSADGCAFVRLACSSFKIQTVQLVLSGDISGAAVGDFLV